MPLSWSHALIASFLLVATLATVAPSVVADPTDALRDLFEVKKGCYDDDDTMGVYCVYVYEMDEDSDLCVVGMDDGNNTSYTHAEFCLKYG